MLLFCCADEGSILTTVDIDASFVSTTKRGYFH